MHVCFRAIVNACLMMLALIGLAWAQVPDFNMRQIGPNSFLDKPWDMLYGPDGMLWVTEREMGKVVRIDPLTGARDELLQLPDHHASASQDGLLGMALHPDFEADSPFVFLSYTYLATGIRRQKLVRFTFSQTGTDGSLSGGFPILFNLPASNDHNSGRLIFGPDAKLYYTIGDQGGNQNSNFCNPILSQLLPTQAEIDQAVWTHYPGKVLRINPDGSIPDDNPVLGGVRSHIFSYGHRNAQGIVFGDNGLLYSDEHGPNTDDEVNLIQAGGNYGWPRVVGFQDDQAYDYCNWSTAPDCENLNYSNGDCPAGVPLQEESSFTDTSYVNPLFSLFAVTDDYDYDNPACQNSWICRPNVAPSSIAYYGSDSIPDWKNSLWIVSLKRGRVYQLKLDNSGMAVTGDTTHHFYTPNRYRDMVIAPDGKTFYVLTGETGRTSDQSGLQIVSTGNLQNPGNILAFTIADPATSLQPGAPIPPVKLWPNPVKGSLFVDVPQPAEAALLDMHGKEVRRFANLQAGKNMLNTALLARGIYVLRITAGNYTWNRRIVVC